MSKQGMSCTHCSRRAWLQGIGVAAAGLVVLGSGCVSQGSDLPSASTSTCAGGTCIDLTNPTNAALQNPDGALLVDIGSDTVMVIRTSATQVIALSAICTHSGCSMNFLAGQKLLDCPCHGSQFDEQGHVVQGPARKNLRVYTATLSGNTITIA